MTLLKVRERARSGERALRELALSVETAADRHRVALVYRALVALDGDQADAKALIGLAVDRGRIDEAWIAEACEMIGRDPSEAQR